MNYFLKIEKGTRSDHYIFQIKDFLRYYEFVLTILFKK